MRYKIAYLTSKDPLDKRVSSGVYYYQSKSLSSYCGEVYKLGPAKSFTIVILDYIYRIIQKFYKKKVYISHNLPISKVYGRIFSKLLKGKDYDFVFADKASTEIAYLKTSIPIIYSTDGTFSLLINYYPGYSNLSSTSLADGEKIEQNAITKASIVICTSQWAANSVIKDYKCIPDIVQVIPRGANIDTIPEKSDVMNRKGDSICKLLFIGYDWKRKGYEIAYKTMDYIRKKDIPVQITVVGFTPPDYLKDNNVVVIPFLNKNRVEDQLKINELMLSSDFLLMPTRAEFLGIIFCESSAFGLPIITTDTGGVSEIVKNGINGYVLPYEATFEKYGDIIIETFNNPDQYQNLRKSSREYFENRLNWDYWGMEVKKLLDTYYDEHLKANFKAKSKSVQD